MSRSPQTIVARKIRVVGGDQSAVNQAFTSWGLCANREVACGPGNSLTITSWQTHALLQPRRLPKGHPCEDKSSSRFQRSTSVFGGGTERVTRRVWLEKVFSVACCARPDSINQSFLDRRFVAPETRLPCLQVGNAPLEKQAPIEMDRRVQDNAYCDTETASGRDSGSVGR